MKTWDSACWRPQARSLDTESVPEAASQRTERRIHAGGGSGPASGNGQAGGSGDRLDARQGQCFARPQRQCRETAQGTDAHPAKDPTLAETVRLRRGRNRRFECRCRGLATKAGRDTAATGATSKIGPEARFSHRSGKQISAQTGWLLFRLCRRDRGSGRPPDCGATSASGDNG